VMLALPRNTVTRFQSNNPDILLSLEEVTTEAALDMADEGEVDIALVGSTPHYLQDFDIELIVKTGIYLYVPTRSPLSQKTSLTLQNLDGQPFITTGKRNHLHRYFIEKCTSVGVRPRILFTTSDIALLIEQAERRQACYFGFPPTIKEEQSETHILKPVDIGREPWFGTYAVRKKDAVLSDAAHIFWLYLANEIAGSRNKQ
ncbi:MAG: LysR family transcriptional regulator substrate-binding protein, partial [Slackia sp.]|nr:LysR family transcriptional regulator substrate-binding protein [Slackia sp.]